MPLWQSDLVPVVASVSAFAIGALLLVGGFLYGLANVLVRDARRDHHRRGDLPRDGLLRAPDAGPRALPDARVRAGAAARGHVAPVAGGARGALGRQPHQPARGAHLRPVGHRQPHRAAAGRGHPDPRVRGGLRAAGDGWLPVRGVAAVARCGPGAGLARAAVRRGRRHRRGVRGTSRYRRRARRAGPGHPAGRRTARGAARRGRVGGARSRPIGAGLDHRPGHTPTAARGPVRDAHR